MICAARQAAINGDSQVGATVRKQIGSVRVRGVRDYGIARHRAAVFLAAMLACLLMAIAAAPASASWGLVNSVGNGDLDVPIGVAVDEVGNVYVGSYEDDFVDEFNLAGGLVSPSPFGSGVAAEFSGLAVNPISHNVYAVGANGGTIYVFDPQSGQLEHEFRIPEALYPAGYAEIAIASDADGNLYIPDVQDNWIEVVSEEGGAPEGGVTPPIIDPTGELRGITGEGEHEFKEPEGVAIGPEGNVWVADTGDNRIEEFTSDGTFLMEIQNVPDVQDLALNDSGDVFASLGGSDQDVIEYNVSGAKIAEFGKGLLSAGPYGSPNGIAYDPSNHSLYVADGGGNLLQQFAGGEWGAATRLATGAANAVTLNGTVEPSSETITSCRFEYGPTSSYGHTASCSPVGSYTESKSVSANVGELPVGDHFRIVVANSEGVMQSGADLVYAPPAVSSATSEGVEVKRATVRANVDPRGAQTTCHLEYVTESMFDASEYANATVAPCLRALTNVGEETREFELAGLQPSTTYHYRVVATNLAGTTFGADQTFVTFGIVPGSFSFAALDERSELLSDAGGHPYDLVDTFRLNTSPQKSEASGKGNPGATDANPKDVVTELPPGLVGNPDATPSCVPYDVAHADCSGATQVGMMHIYTANPANTSKGGLTGGTPVPIYNLVPPKGLAAQFGARFNADVTVHIDARVRTGGDYGVTAEVINSSAGEGLVVAEVALWGVPAAESHDDERYCPAPGALNEEHLGEGIYETHPCTERGPLIPFLSNPTACTGEREARMTVEPWQEDEPRVVVGASDKMPAITGCGKLAFKPSMTIAPTSTASDSPSGLNVELKVPQNEDPNGLATADLKDAKVTLPEGVTVNPSSANGMTSCPQLTGKEGHPDVPGIDLENGEGANCPNASKVGTVKIKTPLLEEELEGGVYVAQQNANPFKSLLALYIAAEAPERGVVVKLAGHVELNPTTGQLTTTFDENPQLPFETLKLDFFGGERAALATPRTCGSYQPSALLEPFSHQGAEGEEGTPNAEPFIAPFEVTSGPGGSACGGSPFAPSFSAGVEANQAGSYSPFVLNLTRKDGEQRLSTVSLKMPLGLAGMISKVTPCGNAEAEAGDCPASSKIGHVTAEAGVGSEPVVLPQAGKPEDPVYLTEKYDGAPFGLSIVVPAEAGPFDLGTVVVRSRIEVNPRTAQVSVVSNPMPTILQGVPLDVKAIHVVVDRSDFMFNPTSCEPMAVSGAIGSAEGSSDAVSSRFQAAGCRGLAFEPKFSAAIHAKHSKRDGEYLHVTVKSTFGDANIAKVHVTLPGKLPSRLETLKLACTESQFNANPAGCPAGSFVGTAVAHTPVLPVPLTGPAIFVSHGGAGFPNLDVVLQGDGVTVQLVGDTFINKQSITTSTFEGLPDLPISQFDLVLPAGSHSALSGNGNMCSMPLYMPTTLTGQNGAVKTQRTQLKVEGCKPEILILGHSVKGTSAEIHVHVPSAGALTASGAGVTGTHKRVHAGNVNVAVTLSQHELSLLSRYPGRRLRVRVHLRFKPSHGKVISTSVVLLMG